MTAASSWQAPAPTCSSPPGTSSTGSGRRTPWDGFETWGHDANLVGLDGLAHWDFEELRRDHYRWPQEQGPGARDAKGRTAEEYLAANWPEAASDEEASAGYDSDFWALPASAMGATYWARNVQ